MTFSVSNPADDESNPQGLRQALAEVGLDLEVLERGVIFEGGARADLVGRRGTSPVVVTECLSRGEEALRGILELLVAVRRDRELLTRLVGPSEGPTRLVVILGSPGQDLRERLRVLPVELFEWRSLQGEGGRIRVLVAVGEEAPQELPSDPIHVEATIGPPVEAGPPVESEVQVSDRVEGVPEELEAFNAEWRARVQRIDPDLAPRTTVDGFEGRLGAHRLYAVRWEGRGACIELEEVAFHLSGREPTALRETLERCLAALLDSYLRRAPMAAPCEGEEPPADLKQLLSRLMDEEAEQLEQVTLRPAMGPVLTPEEYDALRG